MSFVSSLNIVIFFVIYTLRISSRGQAVNSSAPDPPLLQGRGMLRLPESGPNIFALTGAD
jgi:hypothetical protein